MNRKIYVVGGARNYANWMEGQEVKRIKDADLVLFTGGEDVDPALYGARPHVTTFSSKWRDEREVEDFKKAQALDKKMIGICRGAQFLCAMAGGTLVQHQRHPWVHGMETNDGKILVTSTHHQRQYPWGGKRPKFELVGWCNNLSPFSYGEDEENLDGKPEVEMAIYPDINALAIQSHPEMAYPVIQEWERTYIDYCRNLLNGFMK